MCVCVCVCVCHCVRENVNIEGRLTDRFFKWIRDQAQPKQKITPHIPTPARLIPRAFDAFY